MIRNSPNKLLPKLLLVGAIIAVRFLPFFLGKTLFFGDNYSLLVPGRIFTASWLREGILPLWNPYLFAGISWVGDINQSIIYPTTLIFLIFKAAGALNLTILIHIFITFLGMFCLTKVWTKNTWTAIIAGVMWMFSTQVTGSINNLATLQSIAWLPWVVLSGQLIGMSTKGIYLFPLFATLQFFGGYPQHLMYAAILAVIFSWLWRCVSLKQLIKRWLMAGLLTIGLSAVLLFPFWESITQSTRSIQSAQQALAGSLPPAMALKMVIPYVFDMPKMGIRWGAAWSGQPNLFAYVTWFGLMAIVFGLKQKRGRNRLDMTLIALIGVTILLALGNQLPGYGWIYQKIPLVNFGRYPSMSLILTNLLLCLLAARYLSWLRYSVREYRGFMILALGLALGSLVGWWLVNYAHFPWWQMLDRFTGYQLSSSVFHNQAKDKLILMVIFYNVGINAVLLALSLWSFRRKMWWLLTVFIALDMAFNTQGLLFFANSNIYNPVGDRNPAINKVINSVLNPQVRFLTRNMNMPYTDFGMYWEALVTRRPFSDSFVDQLELTDKQTLVRLKDGETPDWNITNRVPIINGYTTLLPTDFAKIWSLEAETRINFLPTIQPMNETLKQWAVKYYLADRFFVSREEFSGLQTVYQDKNFSLYQIPDVLPRFRTIDNEPLMMNNYSEQPNRIDFSIPPFFKDGKIIMADRYDPDWQLAVDGQPRPITNQNGMRLISVPKNGTKIELTYMPRLFYLGAVVSGVTLMLWGGLLYLTLKANRSQA